MKNRLEIESSNNQSSSRSEINRLRALQILRSKKLLSGKSSKTPQISKRETVVTPNSGSVATSKKKKDRTCAWSRKAKGTIRACSTSTFGTVATDNISYASFGGSSVHDAIAALPIIEEDHDDIEKGNEIVPNELHCTIPDVEQNQ